MTIQETKKLIVGDNIKLPGGYKIDINGRLQYKLGWQVEQVMDNGIFISAIDLTGSTEITNLQNVFIKYEYNLLKDYVNMNINYSTP